MNLKDYLHYYLGRPYWTNNSEGEVNYETLKYVYQFIEEDKGVQLMLRRIESLTESECYELNKIEPTFVPGTSDDYIRNRLHVIYDAIINYRNLKPKTFHYLLSLGIDLFGLIDAGLAVDVETLKEQP